MPKQDTHNPETQQAHRDAPWADIQIANASLVLSYRSSADWIRAIQTAGLSFGLSTNHWRQLLDFRTHNHVPIGPAGDVHVDSMALMPKNGVAPDLVAVAAAQR